MEKEKKKKKMSPVRMGAFCLCAVVLVVALYQLAQYYQTGQREQAAFDTLTQSVAASSGGANKNDQEDPAQRLAGYGALKEQNNDMIGWIRVGGTRIDYPVMATPEDPEYYLHRGFDGAYSASGTPFLGADCALTDDNIIIYGHNMKNGSMFAGLLKYRDEAFWEEHRTLSFDTMEALGNYEIIGAFASRVYADGEAGFRYYDFSVAQTPEEFDDYVSQVKAASLYDTGVTATYGDRLVTLSTCSYHTDDGRFVLVAKKMD